jgi:hypothetical protein
VGQLGEALFGAQLRGLSWLYDVAGIRRGCDNGQNPLLHIGLSNA